MSKFKITSAEVLTVGADKNAQVRGNKYIRANFRNLECYEEKKLFMIFDEEMVEDYIEHIHTSKGGKYSATADRINPEIPEHLKFRYGEFVEYAPPCGEFFKLHLTDHPELGIVARQSLVESINPLTKRSEPVSFNSMRVFCWYYLRTDEFTGQKTKAYVDGQTPELEGQRLFKEFCIPAPTKEQMTATFEEKPAETEPSKEEKGKLLGYDPNTGKPVYE